MRLLLFLSILSLAACKTTDTTKAKKSFKTLDAINKTMTDWHQAAANADLKSYIGAMDKNATYLGTDASENWTRDAFEKFCKPYFDKKKTWDFKRLESNTTLSRDGKLAWFNELLHTHMGSCRGSGILEFKNGQWKIMQYVLSMTIPNDATEAVKAAKKELDDAFLKKFD